MAEVLGLVVSGIDLATTIGEFAKNIRDGKFCERREAREFADNLEKLLDRVEDLGRLREDADGHLSPALRVQVMRTERHGWAMLHKIETTIVPLEDPGNRRKKVLKDFFTGRNGRQIAENNNVVKGQITKITRCRQLIIEDNNVRAQTYRVNQTYYLLPHYTKPQAMATTQQPLFRPITSDFDGRTDGLVNLGSGLDHFRA